MKGGIRFELLAIIIMYIIIIAIVSLIHLFVNRGFYNLHYFINEEQLFCFRDKTKLTRMDAVSVAMFAVGALARSPGTIGVAMNNSSSLMMEGSVPWSKIKEIHKCDDEDYSVILKLNLFGSNYFNIYCSPENYSAIKEAITEKMARLQEERDAQKIYDEQNAEN